MFVSIYNLFTTPKNDEGKVDFSAFIQDVEKNPEKLKKVAIKGSIYRIEYASGKKARTSGQELDSKLREKLDKASIPYAIEPREESSFWQSVIISWLPMIFLFVIFFFFMRQLQAGGGKAMSFGKSKAKLLSDHQNKVTFADVAGVEEAKDEVEEIVEFLKDPKKFTRLGGRIPKGVLMMGSPGTGKTLLARAIAGEAGVPFFSISGSDFVEMFVGVGASRVRDLFEQGKKNAPCIIFIDEIDAVGRHRGAGLGGGHDEREQTLNQLLVEMDGFESNEGVILIAATNRPDVLDPALLRPGRFDRRIVVPRPDVRGREAILQVHTKRTPVDENVDLMVLARGTPGFSGADLENMVNEAALHAARVNKDRIEHEDFEYAKDKVLMGSERRSMFISDKEKKNTAYHEAGHVMVAKSLTGTDPVHKVTIIPRGQALGLTQQLPEEDRMSMDESYARNTIAILMGGRLAEELIFGHLTTGAGNDIERATDIAHKMVCEWGMSKTLGPVAFGKKEESIFLGREITRSHNYSERTAETIDAEVRQIIDDSYKKAREILETQRDQLESLAETLLKHETLDAEQIQAVLDGKPLPDPEPRSSGSDNVWEPSADDDSEEEGADAPILGPAGYSGSTS
ncbi:MAG: cell division protein FtsH [Proteobacteria bacterium]|nr:MAG: cell division protein FtsH [Pseudomonadota bacterium]PIE18941.1 MAG: cell division protein FtsH [Pseudomonadota bacterium]